jgi:hypothetical protein
MDGLYLGRCGSALNGVLSLDPLDPLCLVVDDAFDFCLVKTVDDRVLALWYVN